MRSSGSERAGGRELLYLALGDSYTIGELVEPDERWPARLAALLRKAGLAVRDPEIIAKTGWTTDELEAGLDHAGPRGPFGLVTLQIGVNDQYRGRDAGEYRDRFRVLLERAVGLAGGEAGRVIVVSIPDWGVTPFARGRDRAAIAAGIDRFNAVNREETDRAAARYLDITTISRRAAAPGSETPVMSDGLHPTGAVYGEWARLILPLALAVLGRPGD
jgi:lysophospholipase L1-like esterase